MKKAKKKKPASRKRKSVVKKHRPVIQKTKTGFKKSKKSRLFHPGKVELSGKKSKSVRKKKRTVKHKSRNLKPFKLKEELRIMAGTKTKKSKKHHRRHASVRHVVRYFGDPGPKHDVGSSLTGFAIAGTGAVVGSVAGGMALPKTGTPSTTQSAIAAGIPLGTGLLLMLLMKNNALKQFGMGLGAIGIYSIVKMLVPSNVSMLGDSKKILVTRDQARMLGIPFNGDKKPSSMGIPFMGNTARLDPYVTGADV